MRKSGEISKKTSPFICGILKEGESVRQTCYCETQWNKNGDIQI